jgi:Phosphotransferase enzyme family
MDSRSTSDVHPAIIDDPQRLTPEWLNAVLQRCGHDVRVRGCRSESVGTGQMAHNERIFLDYEGERGSAPATIVGKFPSPSSESRAAGAAGGYLAEVRFYTDLARLLSIRVPECFYGALSEDGSSFVLLLEDMAPAVQGDQIAGASKAEIEATVINLAGLHAPLWQDARLGGIDWAPLKLGPELAPVVEMAAPAFIERYAESLSPKTREVIRTFGQCFEGWAGTQPAERTLVHGDYRLDNQLFLSPGGATHVTTVDWQTISTGNAGRDLAYMLGNGCSPNDRRAMEPAMLETYRRSMSDLGVEISSDRVRHLYRHGSFQGPFITILGSLAVGQTDRGDAMFMAMAERSAAQIVDLDALSLIT